MNQHVLHYLKRFLLGPDIPEEILSQIGYTADINRYDHYSIVIIPSGFFDSHLYGTSESLPQLPLQTIEEIPILFGTPVVEWVENTFVIHADLIASTFFLITRYEEIIRRNVRDEHGRFPGKESLPYRAGFIHRPIVDEYRLLMRTWMRQCGFAIPATHKEIQQIYLTHDLDSPTLYRSWKGLIRSLRDRRGVIRTYQGKYGPVEKDPYYTFPWMFQTNNELQKRIGSDRCQSILFVRSGGHYEQDKPHYRLYDKDIQSIFRHAKNYEMKIGLHTSYQAGLNPTLIKKEKQTLENALGEEITLNRHHFLSCREPEDFRQLEAAGFTEDFTMGYADVAGFRLGTSYPVHWIDPISQRISAIQLHPLIIMDCSLEEQKYMGLNQEEAIIYCLKLIEQIKNTGGELVLLWHNTSVRENSNSYLRHLYSCLLKELAKI